MPLSLFETFKFSSLQILKFSIPDGRLKLSLNHLLAFKFGDAGTIIEATLQAKPIRDKHPVQTDCTRAQVGRRPRVRAH